MMANRVGVEVHKENNSKERSKVGRPRKTMEIKIQQK
jgi:hypothetical protein